VKSTAKWLLLLAALTGLWALSPKAAPAQLGPERAARVDSVFADVNRTDGPGCALGVVRDGRLAYAKGYGIANLDSRRPITPSTTFYMGSVSKQFVAAAVVLAERDGHLSLDDPVRKWLPDLPEYDGRPIRLRHLIHHTSGLRDYLSLADLAAFDRGDYHDTGEYLDLVYRQQGLNFRPGAEYRYSNTNYLLLAEVVEAATGSTLREYADERLFEPLGMRSTHFHDDRTHVIRNRAVGYARAERRFEMVHPWDWEEVGSGGLYSSVEDLARWDHHFDTESVGGEGFTEQMTSRGVLANGDTLDYAFGLDIGTYRGQPVVEHGGAFTGFRTHYLRFPEAGRSVVVLCNLDEANPGTYARSVADIVLEGRLAPREEGEKRAEDAPTTEITPDALEQYAGTYRSPEARRYVRFLVADGRLAAEASGDQYSLRPVGPDRFAMDGPPVEWAFEGEGPGRPERAVLRSGGDTTTFRRVEIASYSAAERRSLAGRYHSQELGVDYRIRAEGDSLRLVQGDRDPTRLRPGVEDEFRFEGGVIRLKREEETVTGFTVHTPRAAGIRFERRP
jgi:CubicO group peptidase (beta-lactamase class C family)